MPVVMLIRRSLGGSSGTLDEDLFHVLHVDRGRSVLRAPVGGHYRFELTHTGAGWKISSLTLQTFLQTGNRALLQESSG
jgi:hypothetical protein